jgi:DNA polymerase I-like protein with 3'-5' exonuclease and polymerase domains
MNQGIFSFALPKTSWTPPKVSELPSWADAKIVSLDVECRDPNLKRLGPGCRRDSSTNYVCGFSFAIEDGGEYYVPIKHEGGDNVHDPDAAVRYLRDQIRSFNGEIVGNGLQYDLDWIATLCKDDTILKKSVTDVQIADVLINELQFRYDLDALCERHGIPGKDEEVLRAAAAVYGVDPKIDMWKLPARFVGRYGEIDARRPLQVWRRQQQIIDRDGLNQIFQLEKKVTPILVKMRRRGVRIDFDHLESMERKALSIETEELDKVYRATGVKIAVGDVWKTEVLAHALRVFGVEPGKTEKGKTSVDKVLLKESGEVGKWILRAREWNKLRTTFCAQIREYAVNGRVHCTFNQLKSTDEEGSGKGVRYGRLSSSNYNAQQQPIRHDEFGEDFRKCYVPDEGARWACSDWSQQEPRIGVHYAEQLKLPGAKEFADEYRRNPRLDIHQALTDIVADPALPRKIVKNFVNGRLYGMGDVKLCHSCHWDTVIKNVRGEQREVPSDESQAKIDKFNKLVPWMKLLVRAAAQQAEKNGHVWTILRRRCNFERDKKTGKIWGAHKALSRIGQGGAADQMKATAVAADAEGIPIQMIVHDEFDFSFYDMREALRLKELQMTVVKFGVPMNVDLEVGTSWGDLKKVSL